MVKKISGLSRALYILLAIIAGFVALGMINVALTLVVLGLIAGLSMTRERMVLAGIVALVLPIVGASLGAIPAVGAQLTAVCANLQVGVGAQLGMGLAIFLYELVMEGVMGLTGSGSGTAAAVPAE